MGNVHTIELSGPLREDVVAPARLVFARHAQTAANGAGGDVQMSGWTNIPLSPLGQRQARALERRLIAELPGVPVYSSPLGRAADSARTVARATGAPLTLLDALREIGCGQVDGRPVSEVQRLYPDLWAANERQDDEHFRWPDGESYREFRDRCVAAADEIARDRAGQLALVITHAGVISQIIGAIRGVSPARWSCFRPDNASLTEVCWQDGTGAVLSFDDCRHLADL